MDLRTLCHPDKIKELINGHVLSIGDKPFRMGQIEIYYLHDDNMGHGKLHINNECNITLSGDNVYLRILLCSIYDIENNILIKGANKCTEYLQYFMSNYTYDHIIDLLDSKSNIRLREL